MHEAATALSPLNNAQIQAARPQLPPEAAPAFPTNDEIVPTFEELTRCTWGTHVTVRGQPAKFHQAGMIDERRVVVVLAGHNAILGAESWRCESACGGEQAYYLDYDQAGLHIGTPPSAPLLREQAAASLRTGDLVLVGSCTATFLSLKRLGDDLCLMLRAAPEQESGLLGIGANQVVDRKWGNVWRIRWAPDLTVHLVSARLATFNDLNGLATGTPVTLGAEAVPARLQGTQVRDGTKRFVLVEAAPWLSVRQAQSQPAPGRRDWVYRIRFEEAGLRLAHQV